MFLPYQTSISYIGIVSYIPTYIGTYISLRLGISSRYLFMYLYIEIYRQVILNRKVLLTISDLLQFKGQLGVFMSFSYVTYVSYDTLF